MNNFDKVAEFMTKMEQQVNTKPIIPDKATLELRYELIREEVEELSRVTNALLNIYEIESIGLLNFYNDILYHFKNSILKEVSFKEFEENYKEYLELIKKELLIEYADGLTDILVVTYGAGHSFGVDLNECFEEVHRSNMSKLGEDGKPIKREDGKVLKGPNYFRPNLKKVIFNQ